MYIFTLVHHHRALFVFQVLLERVIHIRLAPDEVTRVDIFRLDVLLYLIGSGRKVLFTLVRDVLMQLLLILAISFNGLQVEVDTTRIHYVILGRPFAVQRIQI